MGGSTTANSVGQLMEADRCVSPWVRRGGPALLAAVLALNVVAYVHWPAMAMQIDARVYRFGAVRAWDGLALYTTGYTGNSHELLFVYSPFAAVIFLPMALVGEQVLRVGALVLAAALVTYASWRMLTSLGLTRAGGLWSLTALVAGLVAWLEPVRLTVQLGQINIAILAVVAADLLGPSNRKWAGIGIGLVAGIKLTPAVFIVYLAAIGRLRAAMVATVTLAVTVVVGFVVLPFDSWFYWLDHGFSAIGRISANPLANTSLHGLFERLHVSPGPATAATAALAVAALAVAAAAHRRGHAVLGLALVGMAGSAVSPFSWSHHWVWFAPLIAHLAYRAYVLRRAASVAGLWLLAAILGGWFTTWQSGDLEAGALSLPAAGWWEAILPAGYVAVFLVVLLVTAVWLWRSAREQRETRPAPDVWSRRSLGIRQHANERVG